MVEQDTAEPVVITGIVVDAAGSGVEGAGVSVEDQAATATSAADGSFELSDVVPGFVYLYVTAPSEAYLDGETLQAIFTEAGATVSDIQITLSGRPSADATSVGMAACQLCHGTAWPEMFAAFDGSPNAAGHSRFVTEGTSHMVYPEMWPAPGDKFLPRDPKGQLLLAQDPSDGAGSVNVVMCTRDGEEGREYLFKFYEELPEGATPRTEAQLDCAEDATALFIPVAGTIARALHWATPFLTIASVATTYSLLK